MKCNWCLLTLVGTIWACEHWRPATGMCAAPRAAPAGKRDSSPATPQRRTRPLPRPAKRSASHSPLNRTPWSPTCPPWPAWLDAVRAFQMRHVLSLDPAGSQRGGVCRPASRSINYVPFDLKRPLPMQRQVRLDVTSQRGLATTRLAGLVPAACHVGDAARRRIAQGPMQCRGRGHAQEVARPGAASQHTQAHGHGRGDAPRPRLCSITPLAFAPGAAALHSIALESSCKAPPLRPPPPGALAPTRCAHPPTYP